MFKIGSVLKIFVIIFSCWLVGSFLFGKFEAYEDGYNEIGFPFVFYRTFSGKCFDCKEIGFLLRYFLLDALIILILAFLLRIIIHKIKAAQ
ncbi:MAG: hypothetical protein J5I50_11105 [Chitinophagaceae bacterium]|nr:hypothetical protein [Chitinophagaceae bacterium]